MDRRSLAICAIFNNEATYLLEWIAYHRVIGFDRFVLYDNGSTDGGADLIRRSTLADRATVIHWPQRPGQLSAYRHFIDIFAPAYDWAAFIDVDEFILPLDGATLHDVLERCGQASAVLVNRLVYGPAGHEEPAAGLVIEAYDMRAEDALPVNRHAKPIVRCADLLDVSQNPHEFRLKGPVCNPLGQEVPNLAVQPVACHQGMVINHYYTRSRREWLARLHGADPSFEQPGPRYTEDVFDQLAAVCRVKDETIKAFAPQVRALLGDAAPSVASAGVERSAVPEPLPAQPAPVSMAASPESAPAVAPMPDPLAGGPQDAVVLSQPNTVPAGASLAGALPTAWALEAMQSVDVPGASRTAPSALADAPHWKATGADAQEHLGGLAMVFRDRSRPAAAWLAALRGRAAGLTDPDFLTDELGRLRDFATDDDARAACEVLLAEYQLA